MYLFMWHNSSCAALYAHPQHVRCSLRRGAPPFEREPSITSRYGFTGERQHLKYHIHACAPLPRLEWSKEHIRFVHFLLVKGPIQTQCLPTGFPLYPFGCNLNLKALLLKRRTFVQMALCWSAEWLSVQVQWCSEVALENLLGEGEKTPPLKSVFKKIAHPPLTFYFTFRGLERFNWNSDVKWSCRETQGVCSYLSCARLSSAAATKPNVLYRTSPVVFFTGDHQYHESRHRTCSSRVFSLWGKEDILIKNVVLALRPNIHPSLLFLIRHACPVAYVYIMSQSIVLCVFSFFAKGISGSASVFNFYGMTEQAFHSFIRC